MRLIDADALAQKFKSGGLSEIGPKIMASAAAVYTAIEKAPTAGAMQVVSCQECAHLLKEKMICLHPGNRVFHTGIKVSAGHYCSYGERKTNGKQT